MLTAIGAWIAAVALWSIWAIAAALMTTVVGVVFYWLLTDIDDPALLTSAGPASRNRPASAPVFGTRTSSAFGGLRPVAVYEWSTSRCGDSELAESGRGFRTVIEPRRHDPRDYAEIAGGAVLA